MSPIWSLVKDRDFLNPPRLSVIEDLHTIQPQTCHLEEALEKSREYWYRLTSLVYTYRDRGLNSDTNPRHTLRRIPKLHGRPRTTYVHPYGDSPFVGTRIATQLRKKEGQPILSSRLVPLLLSPILFMGMPSILGIGTTEEKGTGPNYLGILTVGWCYVLSARLVEVQGEGANMEYTSSGIDYDGENSCDLPETDIIDIGDADENVTRWWYAILVQRKGWKAIVKRTPHREFLAPWTVSRTCETRFAVNQRLSPTSSYTPLTADQAFYVLAEFALLHNLRSQFPIALMTAITLPTHEHYGSTVQLPLPRKFGGKQPTPMEAIPSIWSSLNEELPYYMTLSCSPKVLMSTLCGSFWEPELPCNLVASWLHPLFNEILQQNEYSPTVSQDYETLALIGAIRRPNIGGLWIGAVAGGLAPKIVKKVQTVYPPLDAVSFPWTGCLETLMDLPGSGPYTYGSLEQISRPDVWRLLHLPRTEDDEDWEAEEADY